MQDPVTQALLASLNSSAGSGGGGIKLGALELDLGEIGRQALQARREDLGLADAVHHARFPALGAFHQSLRDALLLELPPDLQPNSNSNSNSNSKSRAAHPGDPGHDDELWTALLDAAQRVQEGSESTLESALAQLLLFEGLRLRLLVSAWDHGEYEALGGEENDVDRIAWDELMTLSREPRLRDPEVRPMEVLFAAAALALVRDASERSEALRWVGEELREELKMRAKIRESLREFRLAESVLLENALSGMLGGERLELTDLQTHHPLALGGLSRQAMDQRVSRGRRALKGPPDKRPTRKRPALYDLVRSQAREP
jgi:hypothetical protein